MQLREHGRRGGMVSHRVLTSLFLNFAFKLFMFSPFTFQSSRGDFSAPKRRKKEIKYLRFPNNTADIPLDWFTMLGPGQEIGAELGRWSEVRAMTW